MIYPAGDPVLSFTTVPMMFLFKEHPSASGIYDDGQFVFRYHLIKIWEEKAQAILDSEDYFLYPFIPIMKQGEELTLEAEKKLYNSPLKRSDKADMLTALAIFAGLRNINLSIALLERRKDIMIESPAYDLIKEEGIEEGIKGIEEGIEKAFY